MGSLGNTSVRPRTKVLKQIRKWGVLLLLCMTHKIYERSHDEESVDLGAPLAEKPNFVRGDDCRVEKGDSNCLVEVTEKLVAFGVDGPPVLVGKGLRHLHSGSFGLLVDGGRHVRMENKSYVLPLPLFWVV